MIRAHIFANQQGGEQEGRSGERCDMEVDRMVVVTAEVLLDQLDDQCSRPVIERALDRLKNEGLLEEGAGGEYHYVSAAGRPSQDTDGGEDGGEEGEEEGGEEFREEGEEEDEEEEDEVEDNTGDAHTADEESSLPFHTQVYCTAVKTVFEQAGHKATWNDKKLLTALRQQAWLPSDLLSNDLAKKCMLTMTEQGMLGTRRQRQRPFLPSQQSSELYRRAIGLLRKCSNYNRHNPPEEEDNDDDDEEEDEEGEEEGGQEGAEESGDEEEEESGDEESRGRPTGGQSTETPQTKRRLTFKECAAKQQEL